MSPLRFWQDLTWPEIDALDPAHALAILPVAAVEQHGPHLPLSVDADINAGLLAAVSSQAPAFVLPPQIVGFSLEHTAFPGTLSHDPETLRRAWIEIGLSVRQAGLRKLLILNSHGGQPQVAGIVARELRAWGMMVTTAASFALGLPDGLFPDEELRHGIHGGAVETSLMLHLKPGAVRRDKIADFRSAAINVEKSHELLRLESEAVQVGWMTQDLNASGACGDARLASAEAGKAILDHMAGKLAVLIAEISAYPLANLKDRS
ncbi:MAG TPA: creatininase family protein [Alphaproteobacteria bacterium]|nr:creatininase family protein [Alphaproteobacteria bacterium]